MSHPWVAAAALIGAVAMVAGGVVSLDNAYRLVDLDTIVFILGMMIVIGYLEVSGFFEKAEWLILASATKPREAFARKDAAVSFWEYFKVGAPLAVMLTALSVVWLYWLG